MRRGGIENTEWDDVHVLGMSNWELGVFLLVSGVNGKQDQRQIMARFNQKMPE